MAEARHDGVISMGSALQVATIDDASAGPAARSPLWRLVYIPLTIGSMICLGHGHLGYHPVVVCVLVLFAAYSLFCGTSIFHETAHQTLWRSSFLNVWSGRLLGTLMFVPYHVYREVHIRHHAYLNRPNDWELWPYADPTCRLWFRRLYAWFDLAGGLFSAPFVYGRIYFHRASPLSDPALRRTVRFEYAGIAVIWGGIWIFVTLSHQWGPHALSVLLPMVIAGMFQTGRKLTEHLGMASYDPLLGTRTVLPRSWLIRLSAFFNFNIFVHGPHHRHPRAAHQTLAETMQCYMRENPGIRYPVYDSYAHAFMAMLPYLFKDPGCGLNAGAPPPGRTKVVDDFVTDVVVDIPVEPAHPAPAATRPPEVAGISGSS